MRRMLTIALLVLTAIATGGAATTCGGGATSTGGSRDPANRLAGLNILDPDYIVELRGRDKEEFPARRSVDCLITGLAAGKVVKITDDRGRTEEYKIEVKGTTPLNLLLTNAGDSVDIIEVFCSMLGGVGESLRCRARSSKGGRVALLDGIDFNIIDSGTTTFCTVNINARS